MGSGHCPDSCAEGGPRPGARLVASLGSTSLRAGVGEDGRGVSQGEAMGPSEGDAVAVIWPRHSAPDKDPVAPGLVRRVGTPPLAITTAGGGIRWCQQWESNPHELALNGF